MPEALLREITLRWDGFQPEEKYLLELPVLRGLTSIKLHSGVTFLVGENGSGKSTLLEAVAVAWGSEP
jgi:predicted ATPase